VQEVNNLLASTADEKDVQADGQASFARRMAG